MLCKTEETSEGGWDARQTQRIFPNPQEVLFTTNFMSFWETSQGFSLKSVWQEKVDC